MHSHMLPTIPSTELWASLFQVELGAIRTALASVQTGIGLTTIETVGLGGVGKTQVLSYCIGISYNLALIHDLAVVRLL